MGNEKEIYSDFTKQCNALLDIIQYLRADMLKKRIRIYNFQYWEFIFQRIKEEYSEIRKKAIDQLNGYHNTVTTKEIENAFSQLEDEYEKTANVFLEKKMMIQESTTYFELPRRTLHVKAQILIYRRLFSEMGFKAVKVKIKKDIT